MEDDSTLPPDRGLPDPGDNKKLMQETVNRGDKRNSDGTIKATAGQPSTSDGTGPSAQGTTGSLNPNTLGPVDLGELSGSGGYEPEDEFGGDEMEEDDEDEGIKDSNEDEGKKDEQNPDDGPGSGNGQGSERKDGNGEFNGSDESEAFTDFNFGDCESNGEQDMEADSELGEYDRDLDDVDFTGYNEDDTTPPTDQYTRTWGPDDYSQALMDNASEDDGIFQDDAYQFPAEDSNVSENPFYYDTNDLYYEDSEEDAGHTGNANEPQDGDEADIGEVEEDDYYGEAEEGEQYRMLDEGFDEDLEDDDDVVESPPPFIPNTYTQPERELPRRERERGVDTIDYPFPIATEGMNIWYTDPILANVEGQPSQAQSVQNFRGDNVNQTTASNSQPGTDNGHPIWEDSSEEDQRSRTRTESTELLDIPDAPSPFENADKENRYPEAEDSTLETSAPNGVLEESPSELPSSHSQPWTGRYNPPHFEEFRPLSFGAALRPVPSLAGRVPVLNVNPNGPRTQVHEWYRHEGAHIWDAPEDTFSAIGMVRRAHPPSSAN